MQVYCSDAVIDYDVRMLCATPYPNHPKGCPNLGVKAGCPPQAKFFDKVYDVDKGIWIAWIGFDFASYCRKMRRKHPDWSQQQVECCLYWEGKADKMLRDEVGDLAYNLSGTGEAWQVTFCPEAMGVNVTETMKLVGVELEWPPKKIVRKVAIFGVHK